MSEDKTTSAAGEGPSVRPDETINMIVSQWQERNSSLPTPDMRRFAWVVYFGLLGNRVVMPVPDTKGRITFLTRMRECVYASTGHPRIVAIKAYREFTGASLDAAKAWVDANPASYDLSIDLPREDRA